MFNPAGELLGATIAFCLVTAPITFFNGIIPFLLAATGISIVTIVIIITLVKK